ncbi:MAG: hypothetical protein J2P46_11515, partial [Zavarzinella sp.]|nr:hypothetical protein [Zavarzinella sp.]
VHRDDERADGLRRRRAQVVVGDLTRPPDVARVRDGAVRMFFAMSVSPSYLEATATVATPPTTSPGSSPPSCRTPDRTSGGSTS